MIAFYYDPFWEDFMMVDTEKKAEGKIKTTILSGKDKSIVYTLREKYFESCTLVNINNL